MSVRNHTLADSRQWEPVVDVHLEMMVRLVEAQSGASIAVSLTTPGGVVSGSLVGRGTWAERWEDVVAEAVGAQEHAEPLVLLPRTVQDNVEENAPDRLHTFVHLVDVTFLSAPAAPASPLWRGRISDVSGWSLGAPV
ncbi:hypothetical protein ACIRBZ_33360 [Streptomyces sp. NPDC094038]|uniref:hypothetical protein n=1 Tax=Streptomyces sp. NPDC094038 TaxID=3366055 RepID=UPI0037F2D97B